MLFPQKGARFSDPHVIGVSSSPLRMLETDFHALYISLVPSSGSQPFLSMVGSRWDKNLFFLFFLSCRLAERLCPSLWNRPPMWKLQGCFGPTRSRAGPWGHRGYGRAGRFEQKKHCLDSSLALGEGMGHSQRAAPEKKKQCQICTYIPVV